MTSRLPSSVAEAAASITLRGDKVVIPRAPRYLNSMPAAFREIYDHLHPEGSGSLLVQIDRTRKALEK